MAGFLSTTGTTMLCPHGGKVQAQLPNSRVKVMGQSVVTQPTAYVVLGCPNPPASGGPCVAANWLTGSIRVKAMGQPLLLQDSQAICPPTGTYVTIIPTQARTKGM